MPSSAATRAGRALALQLVGVALARADGIAANRIVVGAYPGWLADEPTATTRVLAEVVVRRRLFPDFLIRFDEPSNHGSGSAAAMAWPYLVTAGLVRVGEAAIVMRSPHPDGRAAAQAGRAAAMTAAEVAGVSVPGPLRGAALDHAEAMMAAALATLERLADLGWRAVVGEPPRATDRAPAGGTARRPIGGDSVAERTESFDPLAAIDSHLRVG